MELIKKHIITIALSLLVVVWTFVKDLISTGADVKFKQNIIYVIKSKESKHYIDSLIDVKIQDQLNDPFALLEILSSKHVEKYTDKKAIEIETSVRSKLLKEDSIKGNLIHELGIGTGMRNEDIMPELIELMNAFRSGKLYSSRTVRANF